MLPFLTRVEYFKRSCAGTLCGPWSAWMPDKIYALRNTCVAIPCLFNYPDDVRVYSGVHGIWYFNSPYPNTYPPVVFKSRTRIVHESFKGRTELIGDLNQKNCSLQINQLSPELQGKYYFRVDMGRPNIYTYTEHAELLIIDSPMVEPLDEIVTNTQAEVKCSVPDNCPELKPVVSWYNTKELENTSIYSSVQSHEGAWMLFSVISFLPTYEHNGKNLGCKVQFPNTAMEYKSLLSLDIKYGPRVLKVNDSIEATEGSPVTLHCVVDSNPVSQIRWLMDDAVLKEVEFANSLTLDLENLNDTDDGTYTCIAENKYGVMNASLYLSVKYPPRKPAVNSSLTVSEGESILLYCTANGNPSPILTWMMDGKVKSNSVYKKELTLEIPEVTHEGDGEYWCVAENEFGRINSSLTLTVEYRPIIMPESKCSQTRDGIQCVCVVKANPEPSIQFVLPDQNITTNDTDSETERQFVSSHRDGHTVTSILELRGEHDGEINVLCSARNMYGDKMEKLLLQQQGALLWAIIIGAIGGVLLVTFCIATICCISQRNQKKNLAQSSSFSQSENPPVIYSSVHEDLGKLQKKEGEKRLIQGQILLDKKGTTELDMDYANLDFSKLSVKDGNVHTEEETEYAEIRVK
uniref:Myelin associated glycoprotein n=1 Tax=Latimeria chalumnae TaxID=7897 RepID=H3A7J1_LATCH